MASPAVVTAYPTWFLDLANEFETSAVRVKIFTLPDPKAALRLRQQLYGFLRALKREGMIGMYPNFQTVRLVIRGNELHIMHVDEFLPKPPEKTT